MRSVLLAALFSSTISCSFVVDTDRFNAGGPSVDSAVVDSGADTSVIVDSAIETTADTEIEASVDSAIDAPIEAMPDVAVDSGPTVTGHIFVVGGTATEQRDDERSAAVKSDGTIGPWSASVTLPSHAAATIAVTNASYVYVLGGDIFSGSMLTARFAKLTGGVPGTWQTTKPLPDQRVRLAAAATDKFVYIMGGAIGTADQKSAYYAPILTDGFLGDWVAIPSLPETRNGPCAAHWNGWIYVVGGSNLDTIYRGQIKTDGSIASWMYEGKLSSNSYGASCATHKGRLYVLGGYGHLPFAESGALDAGGAILGWSKISMTHSRAFGAIAVSGDRLFAFGGFESASTDAATDTVEAIPLDTDGFVGSFKAFGVLPEARKFVTGFGTP